MAEEGWSLDPVLDSSRMLRAWQTARIILDGLRDRLTNGATVESLDALAERGLGCAANLTVRQIQEVLRQDPRFPEPPDDWKANSRYRLPLQEAESLLEAGQRVAAHLTRRMQDLDGAGEVDTLNLFVGHGAAFRHAAFHLSLLEFEQIAQLSMYHASPILLEWLAGGRWHHIGGEWKIRARNAGFTD